LGFLDITLCSNVNIFIVIGSGYSIFSVIFWFYSILTCDLLKSFPNTFAISSEDPFIETIYLFGLILY